MNTIKHYLMLPVPNYIESINRLVTLIMVSISNAYGTHIFNLVVHRIMDRFNKRKKILSFNTKLYESSVDLRESYDRAECLIRTSLWTVYLRHYNDYSDNWMLHWTTTWSAAPMFWLIEILLSDIPVSYKVNYNIVYAIEATRGSQI